MIETEKPGKDRRGEWPHIAPQARSLRAALDDARDTLTRDRPDEADVRAAVETLERADHNFRVAYFRVPGGEFLPDQHSAIAELLERSRVTGGRLWASLRPFRV